MKLLVANSFMQREIYFEPGEGLYTTRWLHLRTGTDFLARAADIRDSEFSFLVNGQLVESRSPVWKVPSPLVERGLRGEVTLQHSTLPLQVTVHYHADPDHPALRKWLDITNTGDQPLTLTRVRLESLEITPGAPEELQLDTIYGTAPREIYYSGRAEDVLLIQRNARTGEGFAAFTDASGYLKYNETSWRWTGGIQLAYCSDLFPFERRIEPGETFTTAKTGILFLLADEMRQVLPTYTTAALTKKGAITPFHYNTWEVFYGDIDAQTTLELIPIAAQMGMDIFTIDDGWQAEYGENTVSAERFPQGLDPILTEVENQGMRLGLWVPLAVVSERAEIYHQHPEWCCLDQHQQPKQTFTPSGFRYVMCLGTPYRAVAAQRLIDLIGRYHLAYLKVDLTTVFNVYGEAPGCYASGHDHHSWAESLTRIYEAMQWITDQIYAVHPEVLIDLTFELWGQKHLIDYGLLAAGDLDWLSNLKDKADGSSGPLLARTLLYQRALAIPVDAMLIGNMEANWEPIAERFATVIGSAPLLMGDLRQLTPAQRQWYAEKIAWFKNLRRAIAIHESFYPLGSWQQPAISRWDGYARLSREGKGLIVIFKNESDAEEIPFPALPIAPGARLRSVMTGMDIPPGNVLKLTGRVEIVEVT